MREPVRAGRVRLAADIGGTHARLALIEDVPGHRGAISGYQVYRCDEWASLEAIFVDYVETQMVRPGTLVMAIAGYALNGLVVNSNLRWEVRPSRLAKILRLEQVQIVNDFEALACAASQLAADDGDWLQSPDLARQLPGPLLVLGPGTGLGMAAVLDGPDGPRVLPSEAGFMGMSPGNECELELCGQLLQQHGRACYENVLSGPGIECLYRFMEGYMGRSRSAAPAELISRLALAGEDPVAVMTMRLFCDLLGSLAGDLALVYRASAVYLAGGILPSIRPLLKASDFINRFLSKGVLRPMLEPVGIRLLEHGQLGVEGAARMCVDV